MSTHALGLKVAGWQLAFSSFTIALIYLLPKRLLLVPLAVDRVAPPYWAFGLLIVAALSSAAVGFSIVWARRTALDPIFAGERSIDLRALAKLNDDPWNVANAWAFIEIVALMIGLVGLRPSGGTLLAALPLGLFASVLILAASLPLLVVVRREFVRVMELVPPDIMGDVIDAQVRSGHLRGRTSRRLLAAIVTPVGFVGIGSALIAGSHVGHFETNAEQSTLQTVAESILDPRNASETDLASVSRARAQLAKLGYETHLYLDAGGPSVERRDEAGTTRLRIPFESGGVEFEYPTRAPWPVDFRAIIISLTALLCAGYVGLELGARLSRDLRVANRGVRTLGTDAALEGTRVMRPARFLAVAELGSAIELLSDRFRTFAQAQELSIDSREAATRARGRFFASVSHDLKSPLNAILGFAELTKRDVLTTESQRESLNLILQGGSELLALIETILDAARIEAGQLTLDFVEVDLDQLIEDALEKANDLSTLSKSQVFLDISADTPALVVDRLRFSQALGTFIAHAKRTAERDHLRILVDAEPRADRPTLRRRKITIFIEVPSTRFSAQELEAMLSPEIHPGQHRGMALALRLAKSIIELHGGTVNVTGRTVSEPAFAIQMRARAGG